MSFDWTVKRCPQCRSTRLFLEQIPLFGDSILTTLRCRRCFWKDERKDDLPDDPVLTGSPATVQL